MSRGTLLTAPDGARWRVRRRWVERPLPNLRRRFQEGRKEALEAMDWVPGPGVDVFDHPAVMIAAVVVVALLVLVVLPLLGVALELAALFFLLGSGLLGRVLLGRPWIVEAVKVGDPEERVAFAVRGWRQHVQALSELQRTVTTNGRPSAAVGRRLATRPTVPDA